MWRVGAAAFGIILVYCVSAARADTITTFTFQANGLGVIVSGRVYDGSSASGTVTEDETTGQVISAAISVYLDNATSEPIIDESQTITGADSFSALDSKFVSSELNFENSAGSIDLYFSDPYMQAIFEIFDAENDSVSLDPTIIPSGITYGSSGDVTTTPLPPTFWLFSIGCLVLLLASNKIAPVSVVRTA
jgi:hypothetical protein